MRLLLVLAVLVAGCHADDWLSYRWDDRRVLCSQAIDDLTEERDTDLIEASFSYAADNDAVALFHAHTPGRNISLDAIEDTLERAERHGLEYVGFDDLDASQPARAGFAFAIDDDGIDAWFDARELFLAHRARVTFFVTRYAAFTDERRDKLQQLAADGHHVEGHSVDHVLAEDYVGEHGLEAYISDQVAPSMELLRADGYSPTSFAFPGGAATETIWNRVLEVDGIERVRLSPGDCPH